MRTKTRSKSRDASLIKRMLRPHFENVAAYRYNAASIRVRVLDRCFARLSRAHREELVLPLIQRLPEKLQADITFLVLLSPDEVATSLLNLEFENPRPSQL